MSKALFIYVERDLRQSQKPSLYVSKETYDTESKCPLYMCQKPSLYGKYNRALAWREEEVEEEAPFPKKASE